MPALPKGVNPALQDTELFSNRQLKNLILPLIIEQVLMMAVGMADTLMVSYAGEAAISGVALTDMVSNLMITLLAALATGGAVIVSQYLGNREPENANRSASHLVTLSLITGLLLMVLCLVFRQGLLGLLFGSVDESVMSAAIRYFTITVLSLPFLGLYNASAALFRSMAKTSVTMYVSLGMNVLNVIGNAIGIFALHAGVAGVAVPTLISRALAGLVLTALAARHGNPVTLHVRQAVRLTGDSVRRILRIAVPNAVENGLFQLGRVLVTSIVALFSVAQIAAFGVANSIDMIAIIAGNALNLGIVTVVGQCVGAQEFGQAKGYIKKLMGICYAATGALGLLVILLLPKILGFYQLGEDTARYAYWLVVVHNILVFLLSPTSFLLPNALRAAGDVKFTMYVGVGSMIVFRLGTAVLFGKVLGMGVYGVWVAMGADWLARSVCFVIRYRNGKWQQHRAI